MTVDHNLEIPRISLSLTVGNGLAPFELSRKEKSLGPEDWAWLFLRLNLQYREDFQKARDAHSKQLSEHPGQKHGAANHPQQTVHIEEQTCREKYGLSTWLDPQQAQLPKLSAFESWFAPLNSVGVTLPANSVAIDFAATSSVFGIQQWFDDAPSKLVKYTGELDTAGVWFVIDCSVPVDGQFESIRLLSKIYAQELRSLRHTKSDFKHKSDTMIASTHTFKDGTPRIIQNRFPKSSLPAALLNDDATSLILSSMAVHIDLFGNSNSQINKSERLLKAHHKQLVARRIGKPPTMDRLWLRLASTKGRAVGSPTDGNRLKAYVLLAELDMNGISVGTEIVDELTKLGMGSKGSIKQTPDIWTDFVSTSNRSSRFEKYLSEAKKFCSQDYKWLIHTQNPPREALAD